MTTGRLAAESPTTVLPAAVRVTGAADVADGRLGTGSVRLNHGPTASLLPIPAQPDATTTEAADRRHHCATLLKMFIACLFTMRLPINADRS